MKPPREHATNNGQTCFITSETAERRMLFSNERWARLFLEVLYHYRERAFLLHDFVVMPKHFHATITPASSLEKAVQFIKEGLSFKAKKELEYKWEIWQRGFSDHRICDFGDYEPHKRYIHQNPVKRRLVFEAAAYPYSSVSGAFELDPVPQLLKPVSSGSDSGTAKAVPLQSKTLAKAVPLQSKTLAKAVPLQTDRQEE
jgi:REP element-mobilizing transposase RayT